MNRKAAYSGSIALIAVVILVSVSFNSSAVLQAEAGQRQAKTIIDVKRDWQMARYLLDKSASDAVADAASDCGYASDDVDRILTTYFNDTLKDAGLQHCTAENSDASGNNPDNITITVDIQCSKTAEGTKVQYKKNGIEFRKRAYYDNTGSGCLVDVKDRDSGLCEVDTIIGRGCGT